MKQEIKRLLREGLIKINENHLNEPQLTNTDKQVVDFILGDTLNEADGSKMYNKFLNLLKSSKKGLITAAVMTTLLANSAFSAEVSKAPDNVKGAIEQIVSQSGDEEKTYTMGDEEKEQSNFEVGKDGGSDFVINFSNAFKSGSYNLDTNAVKVKLKELKNFLVENNQTSFDIVITASESQVPNQRGFGVGELAKKRASVMKKVIDNFLSQNGLDDIEVNIKTRVGDVEWDGQNAHDEKYTKDQFVKLDLFAAAMAPCELNFSEEGEVAGAEVDYVSYTQELDESGALKIEPGSIPDRMVIQDSNGNVVGDTGYFADKMHQYEQFNYVPLYIAKLSQILKDNPSSKAMQNLGDDVKTFNSFGELVNAIKKDKNHNISKDKRHEVKEGFNTLKKLWDAGQRDFVFYKNKEGVVKFDLGKENRGKMSVFSPIGKTGYNVKGTCN